MLREGFERDAGILANWLQDDDIILVDGGYRDAIPLLQHLGIDQRMRVYLPSEQRELSIEEANERQIINYSRWISENRNGHPRSVFLLSQTINLKQANNSYYQLTGAILNRYHPTITM